MTGHPHDCRGIFTGGIGGGVSFEQCSIPAAKCYVPDCTEQTTNAVHIEVNGRQTVVPLCLPHDNEDFLLDVGRTWGRIPKQVRPKKTRKKRQTA